MKNNFSQSIPYPKVIIPIVIVNFLAVGVFFLIRNNLPPEVPLLYGLPYGQEQLVRRDLLIAPIIASLFIIAINGILIKLTTDNFSQKVLLFLMGATSLLGIVTVVKIALLVGGF